MKASLCIFGEVLFDHFPDGRKVLGGAPFNVAWHLQAFALMPRFISRVGQDPEGEAVRKAMQDWGMDTSGLQTDTERPTGRVSIRFVEGEPEYDIVSQCAYDAIEAETTTGKCEFLYHGSLALREAGSLNTLKQIKAKGPEVVFMDVNLRDPWWQREKLVELLHQADWVKLNAQELTLLQPGAGLADMLAQFDLQGIVLTHGAQGAELLTKAGEHFQVAPEKNIEIVDTVGAGDAFTSVIILGQFNHWPLEITLQRAQAFASGLVSRRGATVNDMNFYQEYINAWKLRSSP